MSEQAERLKSRTRRFALDVFELIKLLPATEPGPTIRRQLSKAASSVDMNYRASCRARSHAEFTAKIGTVAEEADESAEWLDVIAEARLVNSPQPAFPLATIQDDEPVSPWLGLLAMSGGVASVIGSVREREERRIDKPTTIGPGPHGETRH